MAWSPNPDLCALRELSDADPAELLRCLADPELTRYIEFEPFTAQSVRGLLEWAQRTRAESPRRTFARAIYLADGALAGLCSLVLRDPERTRAEIGYVVGRDHGGKGIATAAVGLLLELGFSELGVQRIEALCDPENRASQRVLEKIGMTREALLPRSVWQKGAWRDRVRYGVDSG